MQARRERMEQARKLKEQKDAQDGKVKKENAKPAEKSLVVLDVKPWEADTGTMLSTCLCLTLHCLLPSAYTLYVVCIALTNIHV